LSKSLRRR